MGMFRTIAITFILTIFVYVSHQLTRFTDFSWATQTLIVSFIALLFAMVLGTFYFFWKDRSPNPSPQKDRLIFGSMMVMAYINFLITLVILRDIFAFIQNSVANSGFEVLYSSQATMVLMGFPILFLLAGNGTVQRGPRLKKIPLYFKRLPADLEGLRIIHISDLHISPSLPVRFVHQLVRRVQELNPDLIVFTGDILDSFVEKHEEEFRLLQGLSAKHGMFYVPGNHEYYWEAQSGFRAFEKLGAEVLINRTSNLTVGHSLLQIAGIPDPAAGHFRHEMPDLESLKKQLLPDSFKILLSHQPSMARHSERHGFDLQLSGHTHGGQFFPWNFLIVFFEKYAKGLYHLGNMQLYVNQGTGYWGPQVRLGTYCELTEIVLRKDKKKE